MHEPPGVQGRGFGWRQCHRGWVALVSGRLMPAPARDGGPPAPQGSHPLVSGRATPRSGPWQAHSPGSYGPGSQVRRCSASPGPAIPHAPVPRCPPDIARPPAPSRPGPSVFGARDSGGSETGEAAASAVSGWPWRRNGSTQTHENEACALNPVGPGKRANQAGGAGRGGPGDQDDHVVDE